MSARHGDELDCYPSCGRRNRGLGVLGVVNDEIRDSLLDNMTVEDGGKSSEDQFWS
jgi:hypothetical protein